MITFNYDYEQYVELAEFMVAHFGEPKEDETWFWNNLIDHETHTERIIIWNDSPTATFAALKWGIDDK